MVLLTGIAQYHIEVMGGIAEALDGLGIPLLAVAVDTFASRTTSSLVIDLIQRHVPVGVIALADASGFVRRDLPRALIQARTPTVTLGERLGRSPRVRADNITGMSELMGHLLDERGARRIALVRGIPGHVDSEQRERVFREECAKRGVAVDDDLIVNGFFRSTTTYETVRGLLRRHGAVDAITALNDPSALGAMNAVMDHGLRVPDDVLVSGFDNLGASLTSWPPLTSVDQGLKEQGRLAGELLLQLVAGQGAVEDREVPSRLVVRASTTQADLKIDNVLAVARGLQAQLAQQESALQVGLDMANCRSVDDVVVALEALLAHVGARRCFLGLDEGSALGLPAVHSADRSTALSFCYRDGAQEVPDEVFPRYQLLPSSLRSELDMGGMLLQPLAIEGRERGYVLYGINTRSPLLADVLRIELARTIDTVLGSQEQKDRASDLERLVAMRTGQLEEANVTLRRLAMRDGLTGIANRAAFDDYLEASCDPRNTTRVALVMVDVDMFKPFNDRYGHLAGDGALKIVAECLERAAHAPSHLACRYGGEEFAVVLQDAGVEEAVEVARRFLYLLGRASIAHEASPVAPVVTASVGVAAAAGLTRTSPTDLIAEADRALYQAKVGGRNRVVVAGAGTAVPSQRAGHDHDASEGSSSSSGWV
jgi:diguanylate cyclase (GGDEF)-like protein